MSETENVKRIPFSDYVSREWYESLLDSGWCIWDYDLATDELIIIKMHEWGYTG